MYTKRKPYKKEKELRLIQPEMAQMPPQATDLEESVLGAILIDRNAINIVRSILFSADVFYQQKNATVYKCICELYDQNSPIDIRTVTNQLRKNGELDIVGGALYVSQLTFNIQSASNLEFHSRVLFQYWMKRVVINLCEINKSKAYSDEFDIIECVDTMSINLMKISEKLQSKPTSTSKDAIMQVISNLEKARMQRGKPTGIPSGFSAIDKFTGGWQKSDLIILAGRPGMGKTTFALTCARNAFYDHGKPGLIISIEMSTEQLLTKLIASEAKIPTSKLKKGETTDEEMELIGKVSNKFYTEKLLIDDTAGITLIDIRSKAIANKTKYGIEWIVIDYLQLISNPESAGNREQEISSISRGLKQLAKELDLPIIALSQLSREVEKRGNKKPQLSDLRESGAIEQDADMVCFLYRPEYYGVRQYEDGTSTQNICEFMIEKHRNGPTTESDSPIKLHCNMPTSYFGDWQEFPPLPEQSNIFSGMKGSFAYLT